MPFDDIIFWIMVGIIIGYIFTTGLAAVAAKKPTQEQKNCDFCHIKRKDSSHSRQPILGKCGYETTEAKYCPRCGRKLYESAEDK